MAVLGLDNTNYSGEVLEQILTLATTNNELVGKGLIMVIPGVHKAISIPRIKSGSMLQKQKENPQLDNSKGNFAYSEKQLTPHDMMAFTVFNPRAFEHIWRAYQPKGNLVFSELSPAIQTVLLGELLKQTERELGWQFINGKYEEGSDDTLLLNGILTQAAADADVVKVPVGTAATMLRRLEALRAAIPATLRGNVNLRILMSVSDFDTYDSELTARIHKGADYTEEAKERYKGIKIERLVDWPQGLLVATPCSPGSDGNLYAAVNLQNDENVIQIDRWAPASELYFFKMLMKADTNIGFGEEFIALDWRENGAFVVPGISVCPNELILSAAGETKTVTVKSTGAFMIVSASEGFTATQNGNQVTVEAPENVGEENVGEITLALVENPDVTAVLRVVQSGIDNEL
jgi:hypothetical protein